MSINPFRALLGVKVLSVSTGTATVRMPSNPALVNRTGAVHGGALCALADCALGTAVRSALPAGTATVTLEMKVNFIAAGRGDLDAVGRVVHVGGKTVVCEGEVLDQAGKLVAKVLATFFVQRGAGTARSGARTAMDPDMDGPEPLN